MANMEKRVYKIRRNGSFSNGTINMEYADQTYKKKIPSVNWSRKGKEWSSEKTVKDHLFKWISNGGSVVGWEVVEVVYSPTKPINDWIDPAMLIKILQKQ